MTSFDENDEFIDSFDLDTSTLDEYMDQLDEEFQITKIDEISEKNLYPKLKTLRNTSEFTTKKFSIPNTIEQLNHKCNFCEEIFVKHPEGYISNKCYIP